MRPRCLAGAFAQIFLRPREILGQIAVERRSGREGEGRFLDSDLHGSSPVGMEEL
jgi:hypothetical protein